MYMINIIHQIAISDDDISDFVSPNKDNLNKFLPDAEYYFWDWPKLKKLLEDDGATDVLNAIDGIKPYAYKSDIARYYLIYKTGGWYVDLNNYFILPPTMKELKDKELIAFAESPRTCQSGWGVQNSLFYAEPEHPALKKAIDLCIENVSEKHYGFSPFCPTGPNVLGAALASQKLEIDHRQVYGEFLYFKQPRGFYLNHQGPLALYKPNNEKTGNSGISGGNDYYKMWHDKNVY